MLATQWPFRYFKQFWEYPLKLTSTHIYQEYTTTFYTLNGILRLCHTITKHIIYCTNVYIDRKLLLINNTNRLADKLRLRITLNLGFLMRLSACHWLVGTVQWHVLSHDSSNFRVHIRLHYKSTHVYDKKGVWVPLSTQCAGPTKCIPTLLYLIHEQSPPYCYLILIQREKKPHVGMTMIFQIK